MGAIHTPRRRRRSVSNRRRGPPRVIVRESGAPDRKASERPRARRFSRNARRPAQLREIFRGLSAQRCVGARGGTRTRILRSRKAMLVQSSCARIWIRRPPRWAPHPSDEPKLTRQAEGRATAQTGGRRRACSPNLSRGPRRFRDEPGALVRFAAQSQGRVSRGEALDWCVWRESNPHETASEAVASTNWATDASSTVAAEDRKIGADGWNRTDVSGVAPQHSTIELRPLRGVRPRAGRRARPAGPEGPGASAIRRSRRRLSLARTAGIEPASPEWDPGALPLSYVRENWSAFEESNLDLGLRRPVLCPVELKAHIGGVENWNVPEVSNLDLGVHGPAL